MKISALKVQLVYIAIFVVSLIIDVLIFCFVDLEGTMFRLLIIFPCSLTFCAGVAAVTNKFTPTIVLDDEQKKFFAIFVANERYNENRLENQHNVFSYEEIVRCKLEENKLAIENPDGQTRTLDLRYFNQKERQKIESEINKRIQSH